MSVVEQTIFGGSKMYGRFCLVAEVLGKFVAASSRGHSPDTLCGETGQPAKELARLCEALSRAGLIRPHAARPGIWVLAREACQVTLEDAFRFVLDEQAARASAGRSRQPPDARVVPRDIDLLLTQAAMAIDQSVLKHLRQFSLDRLKAMDTDRKAPQRADAGLQGWMPAASFF